MNPRLRALFALAALAIAPFSLAQPDQGFVDNDEQWGLVKRVVRPEFPAGTRMAGYADVVGKVLPEGALLDATVTVGSDESGPLAAALASVLPKWEFRPFVGADCMPSSNPVHFRVFFESNWRGPTLRITHEPPPELARHSVPVAERRAMPRFPAFTLKRNQGATVYLRMEVAPDGGVAKVSAMAFSREASDAELRALAQSTAAALRQWRFAPAAQGVTEPRTHCQTFDFNPPG